MIEEYEKRWVHPDWKITTDDKKEGIQIWLRTTPSGDNAMKAQAIVNRSPMQVFKVIGNDSYRKTYDETYGEGYLIEKIADQTYFVYQRSKKIAIVSARDFILILHFNMTPEGVIYVIAFNSDRNDLVSETKGVIRASVPVSIK